MTFNYTNEFLLDKAHFQECYDETAIIKKGINAYYKSIFLLVLALFASSLAKEFKTAALFIFALSAVDALSIYFAKPWWVWRQLLSRASNNTVTLTIDDKGIATSSVVQQLEVSWDLVRRIKKTEQGVVVYHRSGRSYLSAKYLSEEAIEFMENQYQTAKEARKKKKK